MGPEALAGVILAGGRATRMGSTDKAFATLRGRPLIERAIARLGRQVATLAISSNSEPASLRDYGLPVLPDIDDRRHGPLSGVLAGMRWAAGLSDRQRAIVSVAVDTPFFPHDLVERLTGASDDGSRIVMACSGGLPHPTFALWPLARADDLQRFIAEGRTLKVMAFADAFAGRRVEFPQEGDVDPFFNINTPEDLETAERLGATAP